MKVSEVRINIFNLWGIEEYGIAQNLKYKIPSLGLEIWSLEFEIWGLGSWNLGFAGYTHIPLYRITISSG
ncbi:MAG: hypothetical protein A2X08_02195 [Bacteroidetes bacterium GWA2_32_17]|nr:MAG: hypothetical protein A2X08_02195 [Bacteroidetes bacterium GWA2_32_17]